DPNRPMAAVSGAGDAEYLDSANEEMVDTILRTKKVIVSEIKSELQAKLVSFYKDHVIPFAQFPRDDERPDISLLIAAAAPNQFSLWTTRRNRIKRRQGYAAVGTGAFYAQMLLTRYYRPFDARTTAILAIYIMSLVKEYVPDCGKETQLICM